MKIYCCECLKKVDARLITGEKVYSHRPDLFSLQFWECPTCLNFVGCHSKTKNKTKPLGCIANKEIKNARREIHKILDPIWKKGIVRRKEVYARLSEKIGKKYHTAEIRSLKEAREIYLIVKELGKEFPEV